VIEITAFCEFENGLAQGEWGGALPAVGGGGFVVSLALRKNDSMWEREEERRGLWDFTVFCNPQK
jgi:hypothetical protein